MRITARGVKVALAIIGGAATAALTYKAYKDIKQASEEQTQKIIEAKQNGTVVSPEDINDYGRKIIKAIAPAAISAALTCVVAYSIIKEPTKVVYTDMDEYGKWVFLTKNKSISTYDIHDGKLEDACKDVDKIYDAFGDKDELTMAEIGEAVNVEWSKMPKELYSHAYIRKDELGNIVILGSEDENGYTATVMLPEPRYDDYGVEILKAFNGNVSVDNEEESHSITKYKLLNNNYKEDNSDEC